jgi:ribonuclease P protein component
MRRFAGLRRQADFARLRQRGRRFNTPTVTVYRTDAPAGDATSLVGITVTKSIGKAVLRNKLRRRLAAIVHEALAGLPAVRLLLVVGPPAATAAFATLRADVTSALRPR